MPIIDRLTAWLTRPAEPAIRLEAATRSVPVWAGRDTAPRAVNPDSAMSLAAVYRAVQIQTVAASQLPIDVTRAGRRIDAPALVRRPCLDMHRPAFIEYTVASLYLDGSAFWLITRSPDGREIIDLTPINPAEVTVSLDRRPDGRDRRAWHYRGRTYGPREIAQLDLTRLPGHARGLGPISAAAATVRGALDARDYGNSWFTDAAEPAGILSTDAELGPGDAERYRHVWYGRDASGEPIDGRNPTERVRVLGKGLHYEPLRIKPSDAQFLESQRFSTTEIARLFGVPASLLLAGVEGATLTYANVEQEWISFTRFGLMGALREIEAALSDLLPGRQAATFRIDALARADRRTRFEGHKLGLEAGFLTVAEVRAWEDLDPDTTPTRRATPAPTRQDAPA